MYDDKFSPEQIECLPDALSGNDARLVHELQTLYQPLTVDHARSLERVRARLVQREALKRNQRIMQEIHTKRKIIAMKDRNVMEDRNISLGMNSSVPLSQTKKRGSIVRIVGISLVAAIAVITILSFTVFSGVLRPAPQTGGNSRSTITGAQQVKAISSAKLVCSIGVDDRAQPPFESSRVLVDWPVQGNAVAHSNGGSMIFSAKDCGGKKTLAHENYQAAGSPDGKKIATASYNANTLDIEDSNGDTIKSITFAQLGVHVLPEMVWSSDSTKIIFIAEGANYASVIKSVDANGGNLKTLITVDGNKGARGFLELSPGGKYAFMSDFDFTAKQKIYSIWDVSTGKKMSDITSGIEKNGFLGLGFSPDSSLLAVSGDNQINIFSAANGKIVNTLDYKKAEDVAWSPDGKYLAVCSTSISIYDVKALQAVTTFGKVADPAKQKVSDLAWSPDGTGLVSSLEQPDEGKPTPVYVWALS
ncbi:hypothetical protein KSF_083290 [Reticulibacter mediterranei]|uniref:WD40 repeat domain-containing protein n=1 Tax=Reticulibacter mediterranei TaxID=2778369 RepID=A0A8J3IY99_9CHLR|nr:hypothetical protein [Reticulibacter mediterranei]GHO98281.1 hypothetical protein KSF_083290 [Reticulibacter mediterranei]